MGNIPLEVIYEDMHLVAVEKPAGMHTAPLRQGEGGTLLDLIIERFPEVGGLPGIKEVEPGLLHRLDRDTSGIVIAARTAHAFGMLREQMASGGARKEYLALCMQEAGGSDYGREARSASYVAGSRLAIESRFAPSGPGGKRVRVILPGERDERRLRKATHRLYNTTIEIERSAGELFLVRAGLARGFRHQVRAHLACLGLPIAGDRLYGAPAPAGAEARMYLHAAVVELAHPDSGKRLRIVSPLPASFMRLLP